MRKRQTAPPARDLPQAASSAAEATDPERWVDEHGDYLYSYAVFRLRDSAKSQDAVQETFLAALKSGRTFAGRSAERGWLLGILKHKISDAFREASRESSFSDMNFYEEEENAPFATGGLRKDAWIHSLGPSHWPAYPGQDLDREEFWKAFRACAARLPRRIREAFLMREVDEAETGAICETLNIRENNLWVMLHRARMALRRCLELNWFKPARLPGSKGKSTVTK